MKVHCCSAGKYVPPFDWVMPNIKQNEKKKNLPQEAYNVRFIIRDIGKTGVTPHREVSEESIVFLEMFKILLRVGSNRAEYMSRRYAVPK